MCCFIWKYRSPLTSYWLLGFLFPRPSCSFVLGSRTSSVVLSWAKGKNLEGYYSPLNVIKNIVSGFLRTVPGEEARTKMQEGLLRTLNSELNARFPLLPQLPPPSSNGYMGTFSRPGTLHSLLTLVQIQFSRPVP